MIVEYGARNCWAFKEWMVVSFQFNKNVPDEYGFSDCRVSPALCFEGGNASGKSCGLRVLSFIMDFCRNSFLRGSESDILLDTFFNNDDDSELFIKFTLPEHTDEIYDYEVKLTQRKVLEEKLSFYEENRKKLLIHRKDNRIIKNTLSSNIENILLRDNCSFISTFIQYGVPEIAPFNLFFGNIISNVTYNQTVDEQLIDYVASYYSKNPEMHRRVVKQLKIFDTGIEDVKIIKGADINGNNQYLSQFFHATDEDNNTLSYFDQSTGTKLLYNRLRDFFLTIDIGGVLVYDEIDMHLHSRIVPYLYNFFLDREQNTNHAQIIFTSHDSSIIDDMKKYRTYLFNKEDGESYCYRVDELPGNVVLRNERSLETTYKTGVLGGVPNV